MPLDVDADVLIVGSGAAGATCARVLAAAGRRVVVVEEGGPPQPASSAAEALGVLYRDAGTTTALGSDPMPILQGRCLGGTTVVNGAIQVALPRDVWEEWPQLHALLPWDALEAARERNDDELGVAPTPEALWGGSGAALRRALPGASPIRRNTPGCRGSGRCLQGCPHGGKASVDRAMLPLAEADGALVFARCAARSVTLRNGRATGVIGRFSSGARFVGRAPLVIVAASAIQTPRLLARSGVGGVGRGFMCHPGAAVAGLFPDPLAQGGTQTMEFLAHRQRGYKLETLAMAGVLRATKVPGVGPVLVERLARLDHVALWGVACRAEAKGRVWAGPSVWWSPTRRDRKVLLEGLATAAVAMLEAGATEVWPGVYGAPETITRIEDARRLAIVAPDAGVTALATTHLFGGVTVGARAEVLPGLVVADSSLFPSNIGVNPMSAIMAVARVIAEAWA